MLIGSLTDSTVFDVYKVGLEALINEMGLPEEIQYKSGNARMYSKGTDLKKRIDLLHVFFLARPGVTAGELKIALEATKITCRVDAQEEGWFRITVPPFELRQIPQLAPIDKVIEAHAIETLRSQTWSLEVDKFVKSNFNINILVEEMKKLGASDLHLRAGNQPFTRLDGDLTPMNFGVVSADDMEQFVRDLGGEAEVQLLRNQKESSFQYHAAGVGYLRCSGYIKTGAMALAIRFIPEEPVPLPKLDLPPAMANVAKMHRGLFLVCGITGSGKSTTLAAIIDHMNETRKLHIITTEDPIEFVYRDKQSIVSQRMVGRDTFSFANALRGALREDPDVILVGEMRDVETIRAALSAAETGHLVMSTLHTTTAIDTVNRIISYFPPSERDLIRQEVAYTLMGVFCQRLLKRLSGGRIPCVEILLGGKPIVRDSIEEGDLDKLHGIMEQDSDMQSFDQHAVELYKQGIVSKDAAVSACKDVEAFERVMSGIKSSKGKLLK
ncbi:MAG: PilT/PilU family type 4a pilus ATPase [Candidatus Hydrogenedentes bacterium]|nr:PilT/PilU family type 4a pilus ATPase [Candidatus Hydrogenedentota bacterium]